MSDQRRTKTCRMCYEQIDERAKRCPHCRSSQRESQRWWQRSRVLQVGLWIVSVLVILAVVALLPRAVFGPFLDRFQGVDLVQYAGQIKVVSSEMIFGKSKEGPIICVVGKIRNESETAWKEVRIEGVLLDSAGKLVDVATDRTFYYTGAILPHDEVAFKLRTVRDFPQEKYASHKTVVTFAKDARAFP